MTARERIEAALEDVRTKQKLLSIADQKAVLETLLECMDALEIYASKPFIDAKAKTALASAQKRLGETK